MPPLPPPPSRIKTPMTPRQELATELGSADSILNPVIQSVVALIVFIAVPGVSTVENAHRVASSFVKRLQADLED